MSYQYPSIPATSEPSKEDKLFDVKRVKINYDDSFDELTKLLEEGYDIVEKLEYNDSKYNDPQCIVHLYILRKDLRLSNEERAEYERLKSNNIEYELNMGKLIGRLTGKDESLDVASINIITDKLRNLNFFRVYTQKSQLGEYVDILLNIRMTQDELAEYYNK